MCYHAEFGRSATKDVGINTGKPLEFFNVGRAQQRSDRTTRPREILDDISSTVLIIKMSVTDGQSPFDG